MLHGLPKSIISDRDKIFTGHFWTELLKLMGITLNLSTAYHPQTDGQSERVNQCLEMFLCCGVYEAPRKWKKWLAQAELWYNTNHHSSLQCSPFKAGYDPNPIAAPPNNEATNMSVAEWTQEREAYNEMLRSQLLTAQNKMKIQADKNRTQREFQVGEHVVLKLQPYVQKSVVTRPFPKLAMNYYGPYKVLERVARLPINWSCQKMQKSTRFSMLPTSSGLHLIMLLYFIHCPNCWIWRKNLWNQRKF